MLMVQADANPTYQLMIQVQSSINTDTAIYMTTEAAILSESHGSGNLCATHCEDWEVETKNSSKCLLLT